MNLLRASAMELAAAIRAGEVTSREVVDAHIAQLERTQRRTNAIANPLYDEARAAADGPLADGPLAGVPVTIKESIGLQGKPFSCGLLSRKHELAEKTAPAAQRLLDAGAIPLGQTNIPELVMWVESYNPVYGRTRNAYSARRSAGGSSGGEGAAVGAGGAPAGLGSDVGGSIRIPAFFNGIFGHKGSPGLISNEGQWPPSGPDTDQMLATGPLTRRAEDLRPLVEILSGAPLPEPPALEGLSVVFLDQPGVLPIRRDMRDAIHRAADGLAATGASVRPARHKGFRRAGELWAASIASAEEATFRELLGGGKASRRRELLRDAVRRRSDHTLPALVLAVVEDVVQLTPGRTRKLVAAARALGEELADLIGDGVLLFPPYPRVAPYHGTQLLNPLAPGYCGIFNALSLPVTQVPMGLNAAGLPTGVQVVGCRGNDHVTIAVAEQLEQVGGGWVPPDPLIAGSVNGRSSATGRAR